MFTSLAAMIIEAFALTPEVRVDRRIAKAALADRAPTPGLKKLAREGIGRLDWIAELSPATIGLPAGDEPLAPAVNILVLTPDKPATQRLRDMIHRLIPAPVILLTANADGSVAMTLAPLRRAERTDGVVVEQLVVVPNLVAPLDDDAGAFVTSLALAGLPRTNLGALYDALIVRAEALAASRASGSEFRLPANAAEASERHERLTIWRDALAAWEAARNTAKKEKRLSQAVHLGEHVRVLKANMDAAAAALT